MSEYRKQIVAGSLIAVIVALVLAGGASYLFPLQPTQGAIPSTSKSTEFTTTAMAASTNYTASGIPTTTPGTATVPFGTTSVTESSPTTMITTSSPIETVTPPVGTTITFTMTETAATAAITMGHILTTTTTVIEQIGITDAYAINATQITVTAINYGYVDETLTDILVNGNPLSSVNGGVSNPSLPIIIAPGASQIITLNFSSPLQSGTYFITINNKAG
ncbi:MAG: hypothetical protein ABSB40_07840 [Nitrososphaeria archaeon]|jgi:hypothetical protein